KTNMQTGTRPLSREFRGRRNDGLIERYGVQEVVGGHCGGRSRDGGRILGGNGRATATYTYDVPLQGSARELMHGDERVDRIFQNRRATRMVVFCLDARARDARHIKVGQ